MHACPFFNVRKNRCNIYSNRPFDCQLYPFTITFDEKHTKIVLGIDKKCPFSVNLENENSIKDYFHYLIDLLEKKEIAALIARNPSFIGNFQDDIIQFSSLDTLTKLIINNPEKNEFKPISLKDKAIFDRFFKKIKSVDSSQNFVNLYIWKEKNPVWWKKKKKGLEILLETDSGYVDFGSLRKFPDYIYLRENIANLKGNKYKHKRASCNYFSKNYKFRYLAYKQNMKNECLKLFSKWASNRKQKYPDLYYHKLLEDSFSAHKLAIEHFKALNLVGRVIKGIPRSAALKQGLAPKKICAYTFGFELKKDTFCILLEVCDLKFKGISEFIFREFSKEMHQYKYINTMDDSGLENLRISKLSYHPINIVP
jgi:hypothetical protein